MPYNSNCMNKCKDIEILIQILIEKNIITENEIINKKYPEVLEP